MPTSTPATAKRKIEITNWKPRQKNTLRGYFSATLTSGMIIHNLALHEKGDRRWLNMPNESYQGADGQTHYKDQIEFTTQEVRNRFTSEILTALDARFREAQ